jgi:tRNA1(Val) A37 N6-methylase TrmN6
MELTQDGFLGGRLTILQPKSGYRAGIDPVLLAAAVPARPGQQVLELGLGSGVASLCLAARLPGLRLTGVELQPDYADLARRNAELNGIALEVVAADLAHLPAALRARSFDHVLINPPFFAGAGRSPARDPGRETAMAEGLPLAEWLRIGLRRLRPGGSLVLIQSAARLPAIHAARPAPRGVLRPLASRHGMAAGRVIVTCRKASRAAFGFAPELILHRGARHRKDGDDFAPWARAVLREGAALPADA